MENLQKCSLTESDFIPQRDTEGTELFEDACSSADWIEMYSDDNITDCNLFGDYNRPIQLSDVYEKNRILERKWQHAEQKYQNLLLKNQAQNLRSSERANRYDTDLRFTESNESVLNRQNENYFDAVYNPLQESQKSKLQERSVQTDCFQDLKKFYNYAKNETVVAVKRSELHLMKATLEKLKVIVDQSSFKSHQGENKAKISRLENIVAILNDTITKKNNQINALKLHICDNKKLETENNAMKQIIVKLEKRHREMQKGGKSLKNVPVLTDDEETMVRSIFSRAFTPKFKKCGRSSSFNGTDKKIGPNFTKRQDCASQLFNRHCSFMTATSKEEMLFFNLSDHKSIHTYMEGPEKPSPPFV